MKNFTIFTLCFLFSSLCLAQEKKIITISGQITDKESKETIPYVNIFLENGNTGTISNELGAFEIKVDALPVTLIFSHVGYKRIRKKINTVTKSLEIRMDLPDLGSVVVVEKKSNKIYQIIRKALERTREHMEKSHYGRAFYRQITKNDETYNELYEIFYDTKFNANGISDWALEQGRYALLENNDGKGLVFNKNFTLIDRVFPTIQPEIDLFNTPITPNVIDLYDLKTEKIVQNGAEEIAVIAFTPKLDYVGRTPTMEGKVYIDLKTYDILKLSGKFVSNDLKVIAIKGEGDLDNYVLHYESAYRKNKNGDLLLDYIKAKQTLELHFPNKPTKKVVTQSLLTLFEYYTPEKKKKRLSGRLRFDKSDVSMINRKTYNAAFWRENPIVKRTPVEEEVIASFEKERQFGSIFLNNRNQVSFIPDIDSDPNVQTLLKQLANNVPIQEKIYVHLDKHVYARGETIWYKVYLVDASFHVPFSESKLLYVDLIDPKGVLVSRQMLRVHAEGYATGDFKINTKFLSGNYQLRAYTDRMTQFDPDFFYTKKIEIFNNQPHHITSTREEDFEVQFFPEGGNLVEGLASQVAFKAIDQDGKGIDISGIIKDDQGNFAGNLKSLHQGMNSFVLKPNPTRKYFAEVSYGKNTKTFELPTPLREGYVMSVRNNKKKNINIRVLASPQNNNTRVYLVAQTRGQVYYKGKGKLINRLLEFEIPKRIFPSGILHLTLFDVQNRPIGERLTFIDHRDQLNISLKPNKKKYEPRNEVQLNLTVKDILGNPVQGHFSIAVTDAGQINLPQYPDQIRNHLLLSSDLKGNIEEASLYFEEANPKRTRLVDLVMLVNGWRRFTWQKILRNGETVERPPFKRGFPICGQLRPSDQKKYKGANLALVSTKGAGGFYSSVVDEEGKFCFENVSFPDTNFILIQVLGKKRKPINLEVDFAQPTWPKTDYQDSKIVLKTEEVANYLNTNEERINEALYQNGNYLLLDEVVVVDKKIKKEAHTLHGAPDVVVEMDETTENHSDVLSVLSGRVPGLTVYDDGFTTRIRVAGALNDPLILLNDMPLNRQTPLVTPSTTVNEGGTGGFGRGSGTTQAIIDRIVNDNTSNTELYQFLGTLNPRELDRIEILKGPNAAIYGIRGGNGVIAIYTKKPESIPLEGLNGQEYIGYYTAREFYVPKYDKENSLLEREDKRSTIYWNPGLKTDQNGKVVVRFFNTDIARSFNVVVEGMSPRGQFGSLVYKVKGN